jgi:hypothetical protein
MERFEDMSAKLYSIRNIEGEHNKEDVEILRAIEEKVKDQPWVIGFIPYGSSFKGYSNVERGDSFEDPKVSDLDIEMLIDNTAPKAELTQSLKEIRQMVSDVYPKQNLHLVVSRIDMTVAEEDAQLYMLPFDTRPSGLPYMVAEISRLVTGHKVDEYRERFKTMIDKMSEENKLILMDLALHHLIYTEQESMKKMADRLNLDENKQQELLEARGALWKNRLEKIWGITITQ